MKPQRFPELRVAPQPKCGRILVIEGARHTCDLPRDHLPPDEHQQTTRWKAA